MINDQPINYLLESIKCVINDQPSTICWNLLRKDDLGGGHCIRLRLYGGPSFEYLVSGGSPFTYFDCHLCDKCGPIVFGASHRCSHDRRLVLVLSSDCLESLKESLPNFCSSRCS